MATTGMGAASQMALSVSRLMVSDALVLVGNTARQQAQPLEIDGPFHGGHEGEQQLSL